MPLMQLHIQLFAFDVGDSGPLRNSLSHYGSTPRKPPALVSPSNDPLTLAINRSFPMPVEGQHLDFRVEACNAKYIF